MIYPADFCERKNQNMLFDALKILLGVSSKFRLLLPGSDEKVQPFLEYAKKIGVYDNIDVLGYRRDIDSLVAMCDISVSSSRQEGLPINIIEAMAIGNAVVATDVRGNNDLVENGINGFTVALNDSKAMAEKISYFFNNKEKAELFGKNGRNSVDRYSTENVLKEMTSVYSQLELL